MFRLPWLRRIPDDGSRKNLEEEVKEEDKEEEKEEVNKGLLKELEGSKALESLVIRIVDQRQDERDEGEVPDVPLVGAERRSTGEVSFLADDHFRFA